jgi:aryl-alcohol dehydrogenase-like predicted oxidoreductase
MRFRHLGKTGLRVSELALGTWGLSGDGYGPVEPRVQANVLARALDMGVSLVDTADAYGAGQMELLLGRMLSERRDVVVVTKGGTDLSTLPPRKRFDPEYLRRSVERSLKRLARDRIDVYLLHNPSLVTLVRGEASTALVGLKNEGKIGHWGASVGDVESGRAAVDAGAEVIELAYNLMRPTDLHRLAGDIMVRGTGILARSTLAHGLLAGGWPRAREFGVGDHRAERWPPAVLQARIDQLSALQFLVRGEVRSLRAAAVRFVLSNSIVSSAVLGPRTVEQMEELVRETGMGPIYLQDDDLMRIARALQGIGIDP